MKVVVQNSTPPFANTTMLFKIRKNNNPCFFKFLEKDFIKNYLRRWEQQVRETPGLTKEEKSRLLLSKQTLLGWEITGNTYFFRYIDRKD